MNIQLKHRHFDLSPELEATIRRKLDRFNRLLPETAYLELELTQHPKVMDNGDKEAEITLDIPGRSRVLRHTAQGMTFLEALDRVLDAVDDELSHQKERDDDSHRRGPSIRSGEML